MQSVPHPDQRPLETAVSQPQEVPAGVSMLKAFTASDEAVGVDRLTYPKLDEVATEAHQKEGKLQEHFWNATPGSLHEEKAARSLAVGYMVLTADQLHKTKPERQPLLSGRYTEHASEIYGTPDQTVALALMSAQRQEFANLASSDEVDQSLLSSFIENLGAPDRQESEERIDYSEPALTLQNIMERRFGNALTLFDAIETGTSHVDHETIKDLFTAGIATLAEQDEAWKGWTVEIRPGEGMSTLTKSKVIKIGSRGSYTPERLKPLFAHEVLTHAMRSLNGEKTGDLMMQFGLPGNLDFEEGVGTFMEYVISGTIPAKNIDRYIDVSLALGQNGRAPLTRKQLHELHFQRMLLRKQADGQNPDVEKVWAGAWNHVDRIYRGSLGNDIIAVNPKDLAYHQGFLKAAQYFSEAFKAQGQDAAFNYLMSGCFDSTDERHRDYVAAIEARSAE